MIEFTFYVDLTYSKGNTSGLHLPIGMDGYKHFVKIKRLAPSELMYYEKGNSKCGDWGGCVDSGRGAYADIVCEDK